MRFMVWLVGVTECLGGLLVTKKLYPGWEWFWWAFLGLWFFAGLLALIVDAFRVATRRAPSPVSSETLERTRRRSEE